MNEKIYKKIDIIGSSPKSIEDAVSNAVTKASQSVRNLSWFEVKEVRGRIEAGQVAAWQVDLSLAFALDEDIGEGAKLPAEAAAAIDQILEDVPTETIRHQPPLAKPEERS